jgi:hypothetical protein
VWGDDVQTWLAAAANTGGADIGMLANYGVLGLFAIILLGFGFKAWQRETARGDRLEEELKHKNVMLLERVIPALTTAALAVKESQELVRDMAEERNRDMLRRLSEKE